MFQMKNDLLEGSNILTAIAHIAWCLRRYTEKHQWKVNPRKKGLLEALGSIVSNKPSLIQWTLKLTPPSLIERYGEEHYKGAILGVINALEQLHNGRKAQEALAQEAKETADDES